MICFRIGKTYTAKTPLSDFRVTTLENSLLSQQAVTSKEISVSYTNLQLNPYPNTQLDLFYSDNLSFYCMAPSTWLTNSMRAYSPTWERCWLQSFSVHPNDEDQETPSLQNPWHTNTVAFSRERLIGQECIDPLWWINKLVNQVN